MKKLTFKPENVTQTLTKLRYLFGGLKQDKLYDIEIKEHREKRSLQANSYYWALLNELAAACQISDDEAHLMLLRRYGTVATDEQGQAIIISSQSDMDNPEDGVYCKYIGDGWVGNKRFRHYKLIKGSRYYDSKEMSRLINGLVSECKEIGIETLTPEELARLRYE